MRHFLILLIVLCGALALQSSFAVELYFLPDSSFGSVGDTVELAAWITASDTVRGFTVYLYYDTNMVDLASVPAPGTLIAGRPGLDFRYADHIMSAPDWLEVGATVFSTSYWAGPGELFRMKMVYRGCGDVAMTADFGMRRPDGSFIPGDFNSPAFLICDRIPREPGYLTISPSPFGFVTLRWDPVLEDTLGRPILFPVSYDVHRQQILPFLGAESIVSTVIDTFYVEPLDAAISYNYTVKATANP